MDRNYIARATKNYNCLVIETNGGTKPRRGVKKLNSRVNRNLAKSHIRESIESN